MSSIRIPKTAKAKGGAKPKSLKPKARPTSKADPATVTESAPVVATAATPPATPKALSGLDAAALILREVGEPLNAQDLVKRMLDQGLWQTGGKTPTATIYAGIIREIKAKGSDARFRKADRGRFVAAG